MNTVAYYQCGLSHHGQGRIKVYGGPKLDTVMGPYLSFISHRRLPALTAWSIIPGITL